MKTVVLSDCLKMENDTINVNNVNVEKISKLITPEKLKIHLPISKKILEFVKKTRDEIKNIQWN